MFTVSSPLQDPLWKEVIDFMGNHFEKNTPLIAPREIIPLFPRVLSYELSGSAIGLIHRYQGAAFHKGLLNEASPSLLTLVAEEWRPAFANEVFVFFVPKQSPLPALDSPHVASFFAILELIRINARLNPTKLPKTVFLVNAARDPSYLDSTLGSLTCFGASIYVIDRSGNASFSEGYRQTCRRHSDTCIIHLAPTGVDHWLEKEKPDWISFFEDGAIARPDLMAAIRHFQHPESHPALSGYQDPAHAGEPAVTRDGYRITTAPRHSKVHLHLHRRYWEKNLSFFFDKKDFCLEKSRFPWQAENPPLRIITGLVTIPG